MESQNTDDKRRSTASHFDGEELSTPWMVCGPFTGSSGSEEGTGASEPHRAVQRLWGELLDRDVVRRLCGASAWTVLLRSLLRSVLCRKGTDRCSQSATVVSRPPTAVHYPYPDTDWRSGWPHPVPPPKKLRPPKKFARVGRFNHGGSVHRRDDSR